MPTIDPVLYPALTTAGRAAVGEGRWKGLHAGNTAPMILATTLSGVPSRYSRRVGLFLESKAERDAAAEEAALNAEAWKAARRQRGRNPLTGRRGTILTGFDGVEGSAPIVRRTLLGF